MWRQLTIKDSIQCTGVGVHSGRKVTLTLCPAAAGQGVVFRRTDLPGRPEVPALLANVADSHLATSLALNGASVRTVEHLLAALAGAGVDNLTVEVDGPELPIMDGSAAPFLLMVNSVGVKTLDAPREAIRIKKTVKVAQGDRRIEVRPSEKAELSCVIEFDHPLLGCQELSVPLEAGAFDREISRARTFGFLDDIDQLRKSGMARGGSLDNVIVIDRFKILNPGGLRFHDEFVRHKILDMIGDLALLGRPLLGRIQAHKTGHSLNHHFLRKIKASPDSWDVVSLSPKAITQPQEAALSHSSGLAEPAPA
ncbi:MAG: UDP-3-O-acyl-N-acetylglucosamine deacetylase [Deltaproteobacteria bacterium]|nr:UDP-3-O-acyl-N-acetylglucosamine deacetylase [Deltaproteobacteria bacterium]